MIKKKILYLVTEGEFFYSNQFSLAKIMVEKGYQVFVVTSCDKFCSVFENAGMIVIHFKFDRKSVNPFKETVKLFKLIKIYREIRPDLAHHIAIKPVISGSIAARVAKVSKVVNAITGLGTLYSDDMLLTKILRPFVNILFRWLLNAVNVRVMVQNSDDQVFFESLGVRQEQFVLIRGSGVDLNKFSFQGEPAGLPIITIVSRMLKNKGIMELVEASRKLRREGVRFEMWLVGGTDPGNLTAISEGTLQQWVDEGVVKWLGHRDDIAEIWRKSHVAVLPSYREGLPRSLLEATAC